MSRRRGRSDRVGSGHPAACAAAGAALILITLAACAVAGAAEPHRVSATLEAGRLSLTAEAAPASAVLSAIAKASGVAVRVHPRVRTEALAYPVTIRLERMDLGRAIARVLHPTHYVFVYSPTGLAEVRVYASAPGRARPTPTADREEDGDAKRWSRESVAAADPRARLAALERVSESGDPDLVTRTALDVLKKDRNTEVLDAALDLLGDQTALAIEPLLEFASTTRDRGLRIRTLEMLAARSPKDPRVTGLVHTLANQDRDPEVRDVAADLLKSLPAP
jgi:hypothetical protein